ncbi:DUF3140 domain-containing protein [Streptomyces sp. ISL-96]|uniref:DUF3140 domain-containing protein n=1 Tax=Streptomyces sp. NPDC002994 TaxID=3154441 RepID=UPI001BE8E054|nr:DUF3140 domain-containing protein [Streptomyces sp. ISL-96]MBT2492046.1 DUF3140 domain-containing protein [Streptomyces sp. ISL-96]
MTDLELEALWDDFHRVVNMTSQELGTWLRTSGAGEHTEPLPERAGTQTGRQVLAILGKRRTDLTEDDLAVMRQVVETVSAQRRTDLEPMSGDGVWRHRLMLLGHDPLKPA